MLLALAIILAIAGAFIWTQDSKSLLGPGILMVAFVLAVKWA